MFNLQGEKTVISGIFIVLMATRIIENLTISDLWLFLGKSKYAKRGV